ncbi:cobalt transporter CbiM [Enterococcus faecalis]|nr:cobalt transporter CbiM [Enterococcus faecalis]EKZ0439460.1 cobalt transporter CbiM [Enterococcus faecalis]
MHIPENYLSPQTCAVMGAIMVPVWYRAVKKVDVQIKLKKDTGTMLGISSSLSFLIMMFNLPVPGGTTAHAVGAVLIALLMGPWAATLSVSVALLLQACLFGDGGILAFGANAFSMAFVMPFVGYGVYKLVTRVKKFETMGLFLAGYLGVNVAAFSTSVLLGIQPLLFHEANGTPLYNPYGLSITIPAMMSVHLLVIGIVEGLFTVCVYNFVKSVSKDAIFIEEKKKRTPLLRLKRLLLVMVILCPLGLSDHATAWGEWDLSELVKNLKQNHLPAVQPKGMVNGFSFHALFSDYFIPGLPLALGYILSGVTAIIVFLLIFRLFNGRRQS